MIKFVAMPTLAALAAFAATPALARDPLAPIDDVSPVVRYSSSVSGHPDAFGSVALRAGVTMYDARFRRVAATDARAQEVMALAQPLRGLSPDAQLQAVHRLVKQRVRFVSDLDSLKVSDLWLNAGETLRTGRGDDEDIAIVEMQVLKAAGFPADDLYLSVGRMKGVGAHVLLLARTAQGFVALDHLKAAPEDADLASLEFRPVVTVGADGSWVHGYKTARR